MAGTATPPCSPPARASRGPCPPSASCSCIGPVRRAFRPLPCAASSAPTWARSSASWRRSMRSVRSVLALGAKDPGGPSSARALTRAPDKPPRGIRRAPRTPSARVSALALGLLALALPAVAAEPRIPPPEGFVTDRAGVIPPATRERLVALLPELRQKAGAEIAVVTVPTTAPLDDFTYAMRIADAWKPGRKREDTGVVFLVAVQERKLRILTGYGLEGILPDGLVGEIEDREIVPAFRAGRMDEGIWRGVVALAGRVAAARGVELTGVTSHPVHPPGSAPGLAPIVDAIPVVLLVVILIFFSLVLAYGGGPRLMYGRRGGFYSGGFGGGFGGGGGGFGGFGGGSFGGGGAGRGW